MSQIELRTYRKRWIVLFIVALLNNSNTISWIAFSPIANHADSFYGLKNASNFFSIIYLLCTIPVGICAMYVGGKFGLRMAILLAAWANGIGGLIRLISSYLDPQYRSVVAITGQGIASLAYPFIMYLPSKVAAAWFPYSQRALATTIGVMASPLGVLIANLISPVLVARKEDIPYLNILIAVPAILVAILATIFIRQSAPRHPPTVSASQQSHAFMKGLRVSFTCREYVVLLLVMGGGLGMFNCLYTIMQQLLCPSGYGNSFSGYCAALMILGGIFGASFAGVFVDRTKYYEETMKVTMGLAVCFGLIFLQLAMHENVGPYILVICFFFGAMGMASYPVGLELATECTYPVSESTATGLIVISGQLQSVIYLAVMTFLARNVSPDRMAIQVCISKDVISTVGEVPSVPKDMQVSSIVMSCIAAALALILIIFFHPTYRRMAAEKSKEAEKNKNKEKGVMMSVLPDV